MIAYLDLWTGLAGDMMVGCLLDAGWPEEEMRRTLASLRLTDAEVTIERRAQHGIHGLGIRVDAVRQPTERSLLEIRKLLSESGLPAPVRARSIELFDRLAEVEGGIHQIPAEKVHFHELGAIDSIIDIVLSVAGVEGLGIRQLLAGPVPLSRGEAETAHGKIPVPAPATLGLLEGIPIRWTPLEGEWLTPTGALILAKLVTGFGPPPSMRLQSVGVGAGSRVTPDRPNIVRILVGEADPATGGAGESIGWVSVIEANLDDQDPRQLAHVAERLFEEGALDVVRVPVQMKKGRQGTLLTCLCRPELEEKLGSILLEESLTLGIRIRREVRRELERWVETVDTKYGPVRVKWTRVGGLLRPAPEFDDLRQRARISGVPVWEVDQAALAAARRVDRSVPPYRPPRSG